MQKSINRIQPKLNNMGGSETKMMAKETKAFKNFLEDKRMVK